jgi:hypothetical protein
MAPFVRRLRAAVPPRLEELESRTTPSVTVVPQQFTTNQYTALSIPQSQLLAGDSGPAPLAVGNLTQPAHATLTDNYNGTFTFTPDPGFTAGTTFRYTVSAGQSELVGADGNTGDSFGYAVAVDGDTAVIGARFKAVNGNNAQGAAYVFVRAGDTWTQQAELTAADGALGDRFGWSVAVSGDTALIGAFDHTVNGNRFQEAAYVFVRSGTTWAQQAELTAADGSGDDNFGNAVALDGDTTVVVAPTKPVQGHIIEGAAYVFVRSGAAWTQQAELTAQHVVGSSFKGASLAISGDTVVVGAMAADVDLSQHRGVVFVYVRSGTAWSQQTEIASPVGLEINGFGRSVAVSGDTALIGADVTAVNGNVLQGAAYVYARSGGAWTQQAELTAADGTGGALFGSSLALDGDTAVVDAGGRIPAEVYVFARSGGTWAQQVRITDAGYTSFDIGYEQSAVVLGGGTVVLGLPVQDVNGENDQGAALAQDLANTAMATATVQVNPAAAELFVSPADLPAGTEGQAYPGATVTASGGAGGYAFQLSGVLPAGMSFDPATGQLNGTPTQVGFFPGIVISASDGRGGSGSRTYTLTVNHDGVNGLPVPFPLTIYAPPAAPGAAGADLAFIDGLYHSVLDRDVESGAALSYWENVLTFAKADPQALGLPDGTDPYRYVARRFWESQEHRWREAESYYRDFLGRSLDLNSASDLSDRQYWANQFLFAGAQEADVVRGFLASPEFLFKHRADASLADVLDAVLLGGAATPAELQAYRARLAALDAQRAAAQNPSATDPIVYLARIPNTRALDDELSKTGVLFDMLGSDEYRRAALGGFFPAFLRRPGTAGEAQALLNQRDAAGNPLTPAAIAEMILASPEYRRNAANSVG